MSTDTNWLDGLLEGVKSIFVNGVAYPKRASLNLLAAGATAVDNPTNNSTDVTLAAGGSGAGSTAVGPGGFGMPSVWTPAAQTVLTIPLLSTAGLVQGSSLTLPGVGVLVAAAAPADATHVSILNPGGTSNVTPGTGVAAGVVVAVGGAGVSLAPQARADGQMLLRLAGADTPTGARPVHNALTDGIIDDATTGNSLFLQNALDGFDAVGDFYIPAYTSPSTSSGTITCQQPIFITPRTKKSIGGIRIVGDQSFNGYDHVKSGNTILTCDTIPTTLPGMWVGPVFALTCMGDPTINHDSGTGVYYWSYALQTDAAGSPGNGFNLQEMGVGNINGLAGLDWAMWFNPGAGPAASAFSAVIHSYGGLINGGTLNGHAFGLDVFNAAGTLKLQTTITTATTGLVINTPSAPAFALAANTRQPLSVSYDGTTVRTHISDGAGTMQLHGSVAATGAVVQKWYEDFTVGYQVETYSGTGAVRSALAGQEFGSLRLCISAQHTASTYSAPTGELAIVTGHQTRWLQNFDPANQSVARTVTANNPSGHEGYMVGLSNTIQELTYVLPDSGISVWLPWHGNHLVGGNVENVTFEDFGIFGHGHCVYMQAAQFCTFRRMNINGLRGITAYEYSYRTIVKDSILSAALSNLSHTSHQWCFGALSEQCQFNDNQGDGTGWAVVASQFDLSTRGNYFDNGVHGCVYGSKISFWNSSYDHWYNEFSAMDMGCVFLTNIKQLNMQGVSIGAIVTASLPLISIAGINGAPQRGNASGVHTVQGILYQSALSFSSLGTYLADPVVCQVLNENITGASDPGTTTDQWLDTGGVMPLRFLTFERETIAHTVTGSTYAIAANDLFYGVWVFNGSPGVSWAATSPQNIGGLFAIVVNNTGQTGTIAGPDGATVAVPTGTSRIRCTDTYKGTGTVQGTWAAA
jgi:hypothetical protein